MSMYAKVRRLRLHCEQPRGWNPPVHAPINFERAGLVNIGRASTALCDGTSGAERFVRAEIRLPAGAD